jgi:hypothetical protein
MAITPETIHIPSSASTVTVRLIEAAQRVAGAASSFYTAAPGGTANDVFSAPCLTFLLEDKSTGRRVVFDLGMRKDVDKLAPKLIKDFAGDGSIDVNIQEDVATTLKKGGIDLSTIEAVIWRCVLKLLH